MSPDYPPYSKRGKHSQVKRSLSRCCGWGALFHGMRLFRCPCAQLTLLAKPCAQPTLLAKPCAQPTLLAKPCAQPTLLAKPCAQPTLLRAKHRALAVVSGRQQIRLRSCAGEDTEFAPLLPKLFRILQSQSGSPADIGDEYVDKMRQRVPKACAFMRPL